MGRKAGGRLTLLWNFVFCPSPYKWLCGPEGFMELGFMTGFNCLFSPMCQSLSQHFRSTFSSHFVLFQGLWFVSGDRIIFASIIRKRPNGWRRSCRTRGFHPCPWISPMLRQFLASPVRHQQLPLSLRVCCLVLVNFLAHVGRYKCFFAVCCLRSSPPYFLFSREKCRFISLMFIFSPPLL